MYRASRLIASADTDYSLAGDFRSIIIPFADDCDMDFLLMRLRSEYFEGSTNLTLHLRQMKGNDLIPIIDIYLDLEQESKPEQQNYVGSMGLYGIGEKTETLSANEVSGQHRVFNVSRVFDNVRSQPGWSSRQFKLTLIPTDLLPRDAILTIGRVELYFSEI